MNEEHLRRVLDRVQSGRLSRRAFIEVMAGVGIAAPLASQMLASVGIAAAQTPAPFVPAKRGGGGSLKVLMWSAPTMLNPQLAVVDSIR